MASYFVDTVQLWSSCCQSLKWKLWLCPQNALHNWSSRLLKSFLANKEHACLWQMFFCHAASLKGSSSDWPILNLVNRWQFKWLWPLCGLKTVTCADFDTGWLGSDLLLCRCCCSHLLGCHSFTMVLASMKGNTDKSRLICSHPPLQDYTFQILFTGKCQWTP